MELGDITDVGVVGAGTWARAWLRYSPGRIRGAVVQPFGGGAATRLVAHPGQPEPDGSPRGADDRPGGARWRGCIDRGVADLAGVQLVSESIVENLLAKQALFKALDGLCGGETILTTNTSACPSRASPKRCRSGNVSQVALCNPAHIIPVAEIIKGEKTSDATCEVLTTLARRLGKRPVLVQREVPGFISNRLQFALLREALHLIESGVASAADVDAAIKHGIGLRWALFGPLEIADLGGLDVFDTIAGYLFQDLSNAARGAAGSAWADRRRTARGEERQRLLCLHAGARAGARRVAR